MKTTLAIVISGLIFLATPMLAAAHGGDRYDDRSRHHKSWVNDRHDVGHYWQEKHYKRQNRHVVRPYKKHIVKHRNDHRRVARIVRPHYYDRAAVVVGLPGLVFHFDW